MSNKSVIILPFHCIFLELACDIDLSLYLFPYKRLFVSLGVNCYYLLQSDVTISKHISEEFF